MSDIYQPMSAASLRAKKRCCKSTCLHCPYGHTVKKLGIQFRQASVSDKNFLSEIGCEFEIDDCFVATLKDVDFAVFTKNHIIITGYVVHPDFADQGLDKDLVESYYFY